MSKVFEDNNIINQDLTGVYRIYFKYGGLNGTWNPTGTDMVLREANFEEQTFVFEHSNQTSVKITNCEYDGEYNVIKISYLLENGAVYNCVFRKGLNTADNNHMKYYWPDIDNTDEMSETITFTGSHYPPGSGGFDYRGTKVSELQD
eukprot:TRINITY_DN15132_c0_g1_i1.p1 TRINITY_DN15132_c0_g1~~TRINITY_DN15132_c0_g1_i1.p1  ORF type:complete len:147 (-),score=37.79 TRINITY_DN15132_c0_g1_i1:235-675(-)